MKKFLSFILVLAMVLGCVSMVSFATGEEELVGYEITYNSATYGTNNSATPKYTTIPAISNPSIFLNDEASTNGGQYNRDFTVINPNSTSIKLVFDLQYSKQFTAQEDSTKKKSTWTATGISGGTKSKTITVPAFTAINFSLGFTTNESGNIVLDAGAFTWTDSGNTYTSAATTVAAKDIFLKVTHSTLELGQSYVLVTNQEYATFPAAYGNGYTYEGLTQADVEAFDVPILGGDYISVTGRTSQNTDARVNTLSVLQENGAGTYIYSGWFRWHEMEFAVQKMNIILLQTVSGSTKYPAVGGTATSTDWFYAAGTFTVADTENLTASVLRVQTWAGASSSAVNDALTVGYDMDAVSLRKVNDDGTYTGNLIVDGDCALGPDTDWVASGATISNPVAKVATIAINTQPSKLQYELGEELDTTGLELNVLYTNGITKNVTSGFTTSGFDNTTAGEQTVTVTYEGLTANYAVTVLPEITGYKFASAVTTGAAHYFTFEDNRFAADTTFNGSKTFSYVFYNTGSTTIKKIELRTVEVINGDAGGWQYVNLVSTSNVAPGEKVILTTYADFTDGYTTIGYTDSSKTVAQQVALNQISVRFDVTFANETSDGTSNVLIAPAVHDANDFLLISERNFSNSGSTHEKYRGALPAYDYQITSSSFTEPTKNTYYLGDTLDNTGLAFNVTYQDGSTATITEGIEVTGFDSATTGTKTLTATYGSLTATFDVTVKDYPDVAVKFTSTSETQTSYNMCSWGGGQFLNNDATFNDTLTFTYDVYNVGSSSFTAVFYFNNNSGKGSDVAGSKTSTITIKPGEKQRMSISIAFVDGVATINSSGNTATLSQLRLRFDIKFSVAGTGNALVIAPVCDDTSSDYYITKHTQDNMSKEVLKTLPDLSLYEIVAQKIEVNTDLTVNNIPRYQTIPFDSTDIQVDPDGNKYIQLKYRGYNMNGMVKYLSVSVQKDWNTIGLEGEDGNPNKNTVTGAGQKAVQPYSSAVWDIKIMLTSDGKVPYYTGNATDGYTYASAELSTISLRYLETDYKNTTTNNKLNGEVYYIQALNDSAKKFLNGTKANNTNMTYFKDLTTTEIRLGELDSINTIAGAAPEIGSSIGMNIIVVPEDSRIDNTRLKVTRTGVNGDYVTYLDPISVATIGGIEFRKSYNTLVFKYTGINAQCMADNIKFELVDANDVAVVTKDEYSVREYAENQYTNGTDAALDKLLNDMLVYGAEAQKKIGYNTEDLATNITAWTIDTTNYDAPTGVTTLVPEGSENTTIKSAGLNISYVNKIYFRIDTVDMSAAEITVTANGEAVNHTVEGNLVYTDAIMATGFDTVYTITVVVDGTTSVVNYSVNTYLANKYDNENVGDIVKALNNYGQSAVAYANANA